MDLVIEDSGGQNIVAREMGEPDWQPAATVAAHQVEIFTQEIDPATGALVGAPLSRGRFHPEARVVLPNNPDSDKYVRVYAVSYSPDNVPHVSELRDATQQTVPFNRETEAPVIGLTKPATTDEVEIGITGFTRFARGRRVTVSANADMSDPLATLVYDSANFAARELPRYLTLSRHVGVLTTEGGSDLLTEDGVQLVVEDDASVLPLTIYVTVAHSGGTVWTSESDILEATFAAADGSGGSGGDFDPIPRTKESLDLIV